ncbi:hypothetical protein BN14_04124 [Rhizoctonia solani AG-1 IB]|uniref:Uncharacterized protein n=1 Tax=Thanatephorus cucumeris (strain AG1-IB / isolate 7/3/14) TaxID=1108050 RepID=M5BUE5_THACB|nr:hypothetical protein BN14_04124 [Rhizoctonia solani AG-1 IB]
MRVPVLFLAIACLSPTVAGWAFRVLSTVITEGADAFFEVTDDGGGFWFPYTMTVFKRGSNSSDEQVGLVLTNGNDTEFSWNCNQPAGSSLRFSLMSAARVNAARSGYYEVQSTSLQGQTQTTATSATATSAPSDSSNKAPVGAIVGARRIAAGRLGAIVFLVRRRKKSSADTQNMVQYDPHPHVTPFLDGRTEQTIVPPAGYVSYSNFEEEPPVYSPRTPEATTYYTGSESGRTESSYRPPLLSGKARYLPVRT